MLCQGTINLFPYLHVTYWKYINKVFGGKEGCCLEVITRASLWIYKIGQGNFTFVSEFHKPMPLPTMLYILVSQS